VVDYSVRRQIRLTSGNNDADPIEVDEAARSLLKLGTNDRYPNLVFRAGRIIEQPNSRRANACAADARSDGVVLSAGLPQGQR
jgi:hypothetical protein